MGDFVSEFGGELITLPLKDFVKRGRGDDVLILPKSLMADRRRSYGTLIIDSSYNADDDYTRAKRALAGKDESAMMVCVEDPESASPYLFVKSVSRNGHNYMFPVIFNASLWDYSTDDGVYCGFGEESFNLCFGDDIDPDRKCVIRAICTPGKQIEWHENEIEQIFSKL